MRRYFVVPAIVVNVSLALTALPVAIETGARPWTAAVIANCILPGFIGLLMLKVWPRTPRRLWKFHVLSLACIVACIVYWEQLAPLLFTLAGVSTMLLYDLWYSRIPKRGSQIQLKQAIPSATLTNERGEQINTESWSHPTLALFYRGNWCPLCMAQISEIAGHYRELQQLGITTRLISPQPTGQTAKLAKRFDVPMSFYVDPKGEAAKQLGILHPAGVPAGVFYYKEKGLGTYPADTVLPTVLLTDADGMVRYLSVTDNYRVRPDPETFLAVARHVLSDSDSGSGQAPASNLDDQTRGNIEKHK